MINEGRKRDAAANALLGIAFAANAAQSPQALVRSGHIEGPGVQLMSRMMKRRGEANRNLDSGRVSHPARNRKKKTFEEFIMEATRRDTGLKGLKYGLGDSKNDAISKGLRFFKGADGRTREIRNYGSRSKPGGRVVDYQNETSRRTKRKQRLHDVTPPEHQNHQVFSRKLEKASKQGMDLHHMTPVAKSEKIKASMSDSEWQQRLKDDEKKGIYHGNHPRNLAFAKRMGEKGPGISHHGTIHTRRRRNLTWRELSSKVKEVRQKQRKRKQRKTQSRQ
jgi:hypothetical protein